MGHPAVVLEPAKVVVTAAPMGLVEPWGVSPSTLAGWCLWCEFHFFLGVLALPKWTLQAISRLVDGVLDPELFLFQSSGRGGANGCLNHSDWLGGWGAGCRCDGAFGWSVVGPETGPTPHFFVFVALWP